MIKCTTHRGVTLYYTVYREKTLNIFGVLNIYNAYRQNIFHIAAIVTHLLRFALLSGGARVSDGGSPGPAVVTEPQAS